MELRQLDRPSSVKPFAVISYELLPPSLGCKYVAVPPLLNSQTHNLHRCGFFNVWVRHFLTLPNYRGSIHMRITHCRACNSPLINRRAHAITCSSKCRNAAWRQSRITTIPVKLMFSFANYALITKAAESHGASVNDYVHSRAISERVWCECNLMNVLYNNFKWSCCTPAIRIRRIASRLWLIK